MKLHLRAVLTTAAAAAAALACLHTPADAAGRWRLEFKAGDFDYVAVKSGDTGRIQYYLPYTVTNGSDAARKARLRIEVHTETKKTFGDHFDAGAYKAIKAATGKKVVHSTADLRGKDLDAGASAEAAAHFGRLHDNADELQVRDRRGKWWAETRVLVLTYRRSGDEYNRYEDPIRFVSSKEEVEGDPVEVRRATQGN